MIEIISKITIYFDDPYWVGVFENSEEGRLSVSRIVFGREPSDAEVYAFVLNNYSHLHFSNPIKAEIREKADNPKRRQRNVHKQLETKGIASRSQQALQKQYEEKKLKHKQNAHKYREEEKVRKFELKQKKHKEKHKGH